MSAPRKFSMLKSDSSEGASSQSEVLLKKPKTSSESYFNLVYPNNRAKHLWLGKEFTRNQYDVILYNDEENETPFAGKNVSITDHVQLSISPQSIRGLETYRIEIAFKRSCFWEPEFKVYNETEKLPPFHGLYKFPDHKVSNIMEKGYTFVCQKTTGGHFDPNAYFVDFESSSLQVHIDMLYVVNKLVHATIEANMELFDSEDLYGRHVFEKVFGNPLSNWTDVNQVMKRNRILDMTVRMLPPFGVLPEEGTQGDVESSQENIKEL